MARPIRRRLRRGLSRAAQRLVQKLEPARTLVLTEYPTNPRPMWGWGSPPNPWMASILDDSADEAASLAAELNELAGWCSTIPAESTTRNELSWANPSWGTIDAVMQVHALRTRRPTTYLEVGSGYSTMFARRAIEDFDLPTRIVSIDPTPRAEIDALCDEVWRVPFEDVATAALELLAPEDVFLFDGSHLSTMGSDAAVLFSGMLEAVPQGVLLAIDDIYLPFDYHPTWAERFYGEQYLVAAWLAGGHQGWKIRLPSWHVTDPERPDLFGPLWPVIESWAGRRGAALWLERTGAGDDPETSSEPGIGIRSGVSPAAR